jgi:hypothetical protein
MEISIGRLRQDFAGLISYNLANVSSFIPPKSSPVALKLIPSTSASLLTMIGLDFGGRNPSPSTRLQGSASETSLWVSESSVVAKLAASTYARYLDLSVSIDNTWAYLSNTYVHSEMKSSKESLPPIPRSGSSFIRLSGTDYAVFDNSLKMTVASSASETTRWVSDSHILIRVASGISAEGIIIISAHFYVLRLSASVSFDLANAGVEIGFRPLGTYCPVSGCATVIVPASGLSHSDRSMAIRVGSSAMQSTSWLSDSSFIGRPGAFLQDAAVMLVSFSAIVTKSSLKYLHERPLMTAVTPMNIPSTGSIFLSIYGLNFGQFETSARVIMKRPSLSTFWVSDSHLLVRAARGYDAALLSIFSPALSDVISTDIESPIQFFSYDRSNIIVPNVTYLSVLPNTRHPNLITWHSGNEMFERSILHSAPNASLTRLENTSCTPLVWFYPEASQPYDILLGFQFTFVANFKLECVSGMRVPLIRVTSSKINISCIMVCSSDSLPLIVHGISSPSANSTFNSYFLRSKEFTFALVHDGTSLKTYVDGSQQASVFLHGYKLHLFEAAFMQISCEQYGATVQRSVLYDEALNSRDLDSIASYFQTFLNSDFLWAAITQPQIISIIPSSAPVASAAMVTISASNLGPVSETLILFGKRHCRIEVPASDSVICQLPRAAGTSKVQIVSSGVFSSTHLFKFHDPVITDIEPSNVFATSGTVSEIKVLQSITVKGRNFGDVESSEGCAVALKFFDRGIATSTSAAILHSDSVIIFEFTILSVESEEVWCQLDICGALSNQRRLNVTLDSDPYRLCISLKPTFDRKNDDCVHCCRLKCQTLHLHANAGFCKNVCFKKCSVAIAPPPQVLKVQVFPGDHGDCALFTWELAAETVFSDSVKAIEIAFKSSNCSAPLRLSSTPEQNHVMSCGYLMGTRIFDTKARVIGQSYETPWVAFPSQFYFSILTSPSSVQNVSLVFNKLAAIKKTQLIIYWMPPLHHGGAEIVSYVIRVLLVNGSKFEVTQKHDIDMHSAMWLLDETEAGNRCSVEIVASNMQGKQSASSARCVDAAHTENPVAPLIALSPGGTHTETLFDINARAGVWSSAQGFAVFDHFHPCKSLRISHTTEGRFENVQEVRIRRVEQEEKAWCAYEISVLTSHYGDCRDILVRRTPCSLRSVVTKQCVCVCYVCLCMYVLS